MPLSHGMTAPQTSHGKNRTPEPLCWPSHVFSVQISPITVPGPLTQTLGVLPDPDIQSSTRTLVAHGTFQSIATSPDSHQHPRVITASPLLEYSSMTMVAVSVLGILTSPRPIETMLPGSHSSSLQIKLRTSHFSVHYPSVIPLHTKPTVPFLWLGLVGWIPGESSASLPLSPGKGGLLGLAVWSSPRPWLGDHSRQGGNTRDASSECGL